MCPKWRGKKNRDERRTAQTRETRSASRSLVAESCAHSNTEKEGCVSRFHVQKHKGEETNQKNEESNETVCWLLLLLLGELIYFLWGLINRNFPSSVQLFLLSTTTTDPVQCNSRHREKKKKRGVNGINVSSFFFSCNQATLFCVKRNRKTL